MPPLSSSSSCPSSFSLSSCHPLHPMSSNPDERKGNKFINDKFTDSSTFKTRCYLVSHLPGLFSDLLQTVLPFGPLALKTLSSICWTSKQKLFELSAEAQLFNQTFESGHISSLICIKGNLKKTSTVLNIAQCNSLNHRNLNLSEVFMSHSFLLTSWAVISECVCQSW